MPSPNDDSEFIPNMPDVAYQEHRKMIEDLMGNRTFAKVLEPKRTVMQEIMRAVETFGPQLRELENKAEQLGNARATLIVNFGKSHGKMMKIMDEDLSFHEMLMQVLHGLVKFVPDELNGLKAGKVVFMQPGEKIQPIPHRLIQDNDSHWYMIPVNAVDEFWKWVAAMESTDFDNSVSAIAELRDFNSLRIDGPHMVEVLSWRPVQ